MLWRQIDGAHVIKLDRHRTSVLAIDIQTRLVPAVDDGEVIAKAEGWNADEWRAVTESIAEFTHWSRPPMPADGDPGTYSGTPISA